MKLTRGQRQVLGYAAIPVEVRGELRIIHGITTTTVFGGQYPWRLSAWAAQNGFIGMWPSPSFAITETGLAALHEDMKRKKDKRRSVGGVRIS